jgi:transcriptional regulator with XRE-family HTH domain
MRTDIEKICATKLRELRRRKGLTLEEFEKFTDGEVKAVVLGSYERGTRAISLARLQELANIYEVPLEYFFAEPKISLKNERLTFDLRRIKIREDLDESIVGLRRYLSSIVNKRRDFNGEVLTLRESDNEILGFIAQMRLDEMIEYLKLNRLLLNRS